jgi:hypothetical protein
MALLLLVWHVQFGLLHLPDDVVVVVHCFSLDPAHLK